MTFQKIKSYFLFVLLACGLFSCEEAETNQNSNANLGVNFNINGAELIDLINRYRVAGCNCENIRMPSVSKVEWNEALGQTSYLHSKDMNDKDYYSHTGSDGSDTGERLERQDYGWRTYGENIAKDYTDQQAVIESWIANEEQCKHIMNPTFREIGAGREGNYWTLILGAR